jgi:hypothetical protein
MKVGIFCLCDFAQADAGGKLTIIGIFDTIHTSVVPATHNFCSLAARIRFENKEEGMKKIKISIIDLDGKPIIPAMEVLVPVKIQSNLTHANIQVVSLIPQITFPNFGEYLIGLEIDGQQATSLPIYVRQSPIIPPHFQTRPQTA